MNDLVRLLIAQKADVLLMGGDYQEGCEYVEPLFSALARVKTPMGTYGVMGNVGFDIHRITFVAKKLIRRGFLKVKGICLSFAALACF